MLKFFRINDPYRLLLVFMTMMAIGAAYIVVYPGLTVPELASMVTGESMRSDYKLYAEILDPTPFLSAHMFGWFDAWWGRALIPRHVLSSVILFIQAAYFGILLIRNRAYNENTYLPAFIFGILCYISFDMIALNGELVASFLVLFALNNLFVEIEFKAQKDENILVLGFFLGLSSLLVMSYVLFLPGAIFLMIIYARLSLRRLGLLLFGFLLPHLLLFGAYYYRGETWALWTYHYLPNLTWSLPDHVNTRTLMMLGIIPMIFFFFSLLMLNRQARLTKYQSQLFQVMFWWLVISLMVVLFDTSLRPQQFIVLIPSFAYFISHYLLLIRRRWLAEFALFFLVAGVLTTGLAARYGKLPGVDYSRLFTRSTLHSPVQGDVCLLAEAPGLLEERMGHPILSNAILTRGLFAKPPTYQQLLFIAKAFEQSPPTQVYDPEQLLTSFAEQIPGIGSRYDYNAPWWIRRKEAHQKSEGQPL